MRYCCWLAGDLNELTYGGNVIRTINAHTNSDHRTRNTFYLNEAKKIILNGVTKRSDVASNLDKIYGSIASYNWQNSADFNLITLLAATFVNYRNHILQTEQLQYNRTNRLVAPDFSKLKQIYGMCAVRAALLPSAAISPSMLVQVRAHQHIIK